MEIKTCKDCSHICTYVDETLSFGEAKYRCQWHKFKLSTEEYLTHICDSFVNRGENIKIRINFRKVNKEE